MSPERSHFVARIEQIRRLADQLLHEINSEIPSPPPIADKLAKRICLQCKKTVPKDEQYRRGLCVSDYDATRKRLQAREVTESELIAHGLYAPSAQGRSKKRPGPTALDQYLASRNENPDAVAEMLHDKGKEVITKSRQGKKSTPNPKSTKG